MASSAKDPSCKLYLLTPAAIEAVSFADTLKRAIDAAPEIVGAVQLRLKDISDDDFKRAAETLLPVCHAFDLPLIINDRPDIAASIGEERDTIEDVLEPYLIQQGYLQRTPRGHMASVSAYRHFGLAQPRSAAVPQLWENEERP